MRAALYVRVSTAPQTEKWSLSAQERALIEHCQRQGWDYKIFSDPGISGETLDQRPGIRQLMMEVAAGRYDIVLAVELERFSRSKSLLDWLTLKQAFRQAGIKFGTPGQLYDPADVEDDFLSDLFGSLSKREKAKLLARTRQGKLEAARQGRYLAPVAPFGYALRDGQLVICEDEARIVRYIFTLAKAGQGIREIARTLTFDGFITPRRMRRDGRAGTRWAKSTVFRILGNRVYSGQGHWNRRRRVGSRHVWRPESEWIAVKVPPIIDVSSWDFVQRRLKENAAFARRNQRQVYLLKGVTYCECGGRMHGIPSKGKRYYRCSRKPDCSARSIRADELEALVWQEVVRGVQQPQTILAEARRQREDQFSALDEMRFKLDELRDSLRKLPQERERILDAYQRGWAEQTDTHKRMQVIQDRKIELQEQVRNMEARLSETVASADEHSTLEDLLARFGRRLAALTTEEKAQVVRGLLKAVTVQTDGGVQIDCFVRQEIAPGFAPTIRTLWPPAAAISRARRAYA